VDGTGMWSRSEGVDVGKSVGEEQGMYTRVMSPKIHGVKWNRAQSSVLHGLVLTIAAQK
jgi:hypothetical protein